MVLGTVVNSFNVISFFN